MHVCMLGKHENSDERRGQIKKHEGESYTAEGRIKVNSPKLLLSERGHLRRRKTVMVSEFGKGMWRRKRECFVSERGEGCGYITVAFSTSRTLGLLWSCFASHFQGRGNTEDVACTSWGLGRPRPAGRSPWISLVSAPECGQDLLSPWLGDPYVPKVRRESAEITMQVVVLLYNSEIDLHGSNFMIWTGSYDFNRVWTWMLTNGTNILIYRIP